MDSKSPDSSASCKALADRASQRAAEFRVEQPTDDPTTTTSDLFDILAAALLDQAAYIAELEAHLESLQNRYALVTAENERLMDCLDFYDPDDKGDFLYEQWKDRQLEKDDV